jgi:REP-associated tyrosine transposase
VTKASTRAFPRSVERTVSGMTYVPRIEVPYAYYHVVTRGNNKQPIYADDRDRERFLVLLSRVARRYGWLFYAYCLMGNHYHLVMQIADAGLSRGMCELNTAHAVTFNLRHGRVNHLFGRRYWSERITTDGYLLEACRYVVQNPVRAGFCATCDAWKWSSYRATVGSAAPEPFLAVKSVLDFFAPRSTDPVARFREYCGTIVPKRQRYSGPRVAATVTAV